MIILAKIRCYEQFNNSRWRSAAILDLGRENMVDMEETERDLVLIDRERARLGDRDVVKIRAGRGIWRGDQHLEETYIICNG